MAEKRYAILIASSEYSEESGLRRLRCPENDVRAVDEILCSPDFGQFTKTFVFRNAPSYEILPRLNSVLTGAGRDDLILIYFSGHGKLNRLGHLCLATANTDSKALEATTILASTIKSYFDLSYSRKKILLLDCCYSGAAGEEFARTKGGVDEELQLMSRGQGTFIMTASSGLQTSVEKESDQYGLFTKHLVEGIRSGEADKNEDGQVDMQELYEYVHEKVREEGAQEPMKWDLHVKGKLVVSRSGRESQKKRRKDIEKSLYRFAADGLLGGGIVHEAVDVLHIPNKDLSESNRQRIVLIEQLIDKTINPPEFIEQWVRAGFVGINEPDKPEEEIAGQQVKSGSESDVGKNKRGGGEAGKKNKLFWGFVFGLFGVGVALYSVFNSNRENPSHADENVIIATTEPVDQTKQAEQQNVSIGTDTASEQGEAAADQSAPILVSSPVASQPEEKFENPFVVVDHPKTKQAVAVAASVPQKGEKMRDFVLIPKGCFQMGSPSDEKGRDDDEGPVHQVCVDSFWMGKYEVTNAKYVQFLNEVGKRGTEKRPWFETEKEDSSSKIQGEVGGFKVKSGYERHPVNNVSWYGAVAYIDWLNQETGKKYRLPTEAEWEYAARAGTSTVRFWGDSPDDACQYANVYDQTSKKENGYSWKNHNCDDGYSNTAPIGSFLANSFGLHDMLGNVWEWCADRYGSYSSSLQKNPTGSLSGSDRVIRGGGWGDDPWSVRSADRYRGTPGSRINFLGFRLALSVQQDR